MTTPSPRISKGWRNLSIIVLTLGPFPALSQTLTPRTLEPPVAATPGYRVSPPRGASFGSPGTTVTKSRVQGAPMPDPRDHVTTRPGYLFVPFRKLAGFRYPEPPPGAGGLGQKPPPAGPNDPNIPTPVRDLHRKNIITMGYMLPLKRTADGRVSTFLLMGDQSVCCYGRTPRVNDYIAVQMKPGHSAPAAEDEPLLVSGTLQVGAMVEEGIILGIYEMEGHLVETRADLQKK